MKNPILIPIQLLLLPLLLAACATAPHGPAEAADCSAIAAETARAEAARDTAVEQKDDAWKAVVPFAVAARYASAKSAAGNAEQRLRQLQGEAARQGCNVH